MVDDGNADCLVVVTLAPHLPPKLCRSDFAGLQEVAHVIEGFVLIVFVFGVGFILLWIIGNASS